MATDIQRAFNPVQLARDCGIEPDPWQAELLERRPKRCLMLAARQSGKSEVAIHLGLWTALYEPGSLVLIVSPSQRQSQEVFRRLMITYGKLQDVPGLTQESALRAELSNGSRIIALPGSEKTVRGYAGARMIILDEAARVDDDLLAALRPTMATVDSSLIMLSTPFGKRGEFYRAWSEGQGWTKVRVPASECPRLSKEFLADELRELGPLRYSEEYELAFLEPDESVFPTTMIERAFHDRCAPALEVKAMLGANFETFSYKGQQWTRYPAPKADEAFICAADLGQSQDPTAIIVMRHTRVPLETWTVDEKKRTTRQNVEQHYDVVHAERLPLGTSYPDVVQHVRDVLNRPPLRDNCYLVIDESGVGRAVGDMFSAAGLRAVRVSITAGTEVTKQATLRWSVAKTQLISAVDASLHSGELRFAAELGEAHALAEELKDFRRHLTATGHATYQARTGKHDDLVLAVAIALWWAGERRKYRTLVGPLRGLY